MRKTRRFIRGAGIGSSKMSCTSGECVETPGVSSAVPVSQSPSASIDSALAVTNTLIQTLRERSDELEMQIAQYKRNAITRRNIRNRNGGIHKLRLMKQAQTLHKNTLLQLRNQLVMKYKLLKESNQLTDDAKIQIRDLKMYIDTKLAMYSQNTGIAGGFSRKGKGKGKRRSQQTR